MQEALLGNFKRLGKWDADKATETRYRLDPDPLLELKRWLAYYERF